MEEHGYVNLKENTGAQLNRNKFIDEELEIMAFFGRTVLLVTYLDSLPLIIILQRI